MKKLTEQQKHELTVLARQINLNTEVEINGLKFINNNGIFEVNSISVYIYSMFTEYRFTYLFNFEELKILLLTFINHQNDIIKEKEIKEQSEVQKVKDCLQLDNETDSYINEAIRLTKKYKSKHLLEFSKINNDLGHKANKIALDLLQYEVLILRKENEQLKNRKWWHIWK